MRQLCSQVLVSVVLVVNITELFVYVMQLSQEYQKMKFGSTGLTFRRKEDTDVQFASTQRRELYKRIKVCTRQSPQGM